MHEVTNYFLILGLDPETADQKTIEAALLSKQKQWSRDRDSHKEEIARPAQRNLDNLKKIKEALLDPKRRAEEAQRAKEEMRVLRASKKTEFESAIALLSKGKVSERAIKKIASEFAKFFYTEADVRDALRSMEAGNEDGVESEFVEIPSDKAESIYKNLQLLGKKDLYDVLGISDKEKVATSTLYELAKKEEERNRTHANKDADNAIKGILLGKCLEFFKDDEQRRKYDQLMPFPILKMVDNLVPGGSIEIGQLLMVLSAGKEHKVEQQRLLRYVRHRARKAGIPINIANNISFESNIKCICGHFNQPLNELCEKCRKPLYQRCVKCGLANPADSLGCSCGFSLTDALAALRSLLSSGQEETFVSSWDDKAYRHHPAFQDLAKQYDRVRKKLEQKRQAEREAQERLERLREAINQDDNAAIISAWDESIMAQHPEIAELLPRIKKAHQPPDVQGVEAVHLGSYIQVRWELLYHVQEYIVMWSSSPLESPSSPNRQSRTITEGQYKREGFRLNDIPPGDCYIKVLAVTRFREEELVSGGTDPRCSTILPSQRRIQIYYHLTFKGLLRKSRAILTLSTDQPIGNLPELVLVARPGRIMPVDIHNGTVIYRLKGINLQAGELFKRSIALDNISSPSALRLFIADSTNHRFELVAESIAKDKI